ncbi:hypothetical protein [Lysobacter niastensis]|uniref:Secreted protein n=1 Tax=Lysobacter niastensis TaxID=380629 RepID=A0ABS0B865_9GAMM|nr:hypothetical protein [Lysobacter niastensis]MBF6023841.1 hypothetical protein [Lysobacter niastensis]
MIGKAAAGLALALLSMAALAQEPYVDIEQRLTAEQLREVGLTPDQLQRLNRMLREAEGARGKVEPARDENETVAASSGGLSSAPIRSRLKGPVSGWEPGTVFELENGQQWKVLKGNMQLRQPLESPEVVVVPGVAGRWFLQVDEDMPKARVYRID